DDVTRTVAPVPDDRWFNLGCARHTLAKLRLTRSTLHTVKSGAWQQVQATLKMLSADYCGTGKAFTIAGEPIVWKNNVGMKYYFPPSVLEARWSENGALCLNTPRLESPAYPDVELDIAAECARPPSCANPDPYATEKFELVTSSDY
ncbi:MAG: ADYC domain-containing protein, partial [Steroidobacteraceae bacterium]